MSSNKCLVVLTFEYLDITKISLKTEFFSLYNDIYGTNIGTQSLTPYLQSQQNTLVSMKITVYHQPVNFQ